MFQSFLANQLKQGKDMLMFGKKRNDNGEKVYRYSIRKYHFGAASVAIAALVFFANGVAKADMTVSPATANTEKVGVAVTGLTEGVPPTEGHSEKSQEVGTEKDVVANKSVDKSALNQALSDLQAEIAKIDNGKLSSLASQIAQLTEESKRLSGDENASEEAVATLVSRVQAMAEQVRQLQSKDDNKPDKEAGAISKENKEVLNATRTSEEKLDGNLTLDKPAKVIEGSTVSSKIQDEKELKRTDEIVPPVEGAENGRNSENAGKEEGTVTKKDKLEALSGYLVRYLDVARKIERPETKKLLEGVEEVVKSIEASVLQPQLTPAEIEELLKKGKQAERKLALAVTRENSGKRDVLNWTRMAEGSDFRTNPTGLDTKRAYIVQNGDASGLPAETYLYAMRRGLGDKRAKASNLVSVREAYDEAKVSVEDKGNGNYRWTITFNSKYQGHKNAFYWFTLPKNHEITNILGITKTTSSGSSSSRGGFNFNEEWTTKIKELIGNDKKAVHGPASGGYDFNTAFRSLKDVTNSTLIPKLGGEERVENDDPVNSRNASGYYYLGPLANRFNGIDWGTEVPTAVRDKAARNMEGLHENTGRLYHFTHDAGKLTFTYETHTDYKYAPLYYAAGMRTIEDNSAKQYFMARGLQEKPTAPTVNTNNEGAVTVTPYSDSAQNKNVDKVELSYVDKNNNSKKVTLIRDARNGTWTSSGDGADGIQINGNSFSVKAGYAKPGSEVSAISSFGNSDASERSRVTVPTDTQPPVVKIRTGQSTTKLPETSPSDAIYTVTQGQPFAPNLEAFDNTGKITKFELGGDLPTGVRLTNATNLSTSTFDESNPYRPTFTGDVPNDFTPGSYTRTITVNDGKTGDKTYYFKYKVLPKAPTITTEAKYKGALVSTDRSISGTGHPGATITVTLQDGTTTGTATVGQNGQWTYSLKDSEMLTQNDKQDATTKSENPVKIKQSLNGAESAETRVNVKLARAISIDTPVQAGRDITVKIPHDAGLFYVQVIHGNNQTYEYAVRKNGNTWAITDRDKANITELRVANGANVSEKILTFHIKDAKNNIPYKIPAGDQKIKFRVHYDNAPSNNNPADPAEENGGWVTASPATNTNPTITVKAPNTRNYTVDGSLTMAGLKNLVTVADTEDDADKTVGNRVGDNFTLTVKQGANVVDLSNNKYLKKGTYTLTYTTTDAAGATITKEHTITVNYAAAAKPTINLIQGESLTEAEKRSLLQLQDGTSKIDVPSDARVEVTLDTSSESNGRTASATVVFADNTRTAPININYKVYKNFETVTKVYDFAGVDRNDSPSSYYKNPGGLPGGMSWVFKKGNGTLGTADNNKLKESLNADGVGTTTYNFGAKYPIGRFTDSPSDAEKLSYTPTFTHEVFDVGANPTKVVANHGVSLNAAQAESAVVKTSTSPTLPAGTTYEWVKSATDATVLTDAEKNVTEFGEITRYVKVTLPKVSETGPSANQVQPYKIIPVTLKVNETVKPVVKLVGDDGRDITLTEGTADGNLPKVTVYRGEKANVRLKTYDNTGKIKEFRGGGMPNGIWFNKDPNADREVWLTSDTATETNPLSHTITGVVETQNGLGDRIVTLTVSDKTTPTNTTTVKFKMVVKEQKEKYDPTKPTNAVSFNNLGSNIPATDANKITDQVNVPNLSAEATNAGGVTKALKDNGVVKTVAGKKVVTVTVTYPDRSTDEVDVPVAQNYNVVARPTINLKQGETLSDTDKRSLVQLQDGENKVDIPSDANVSLTLDTNKSATDGKVVTKTATATVTFADRTVRTVAVNYKVLSTFPIANTIYDFAGVSHGSDHSGYYVNNGRNIPDNMSWFYKKENGTEKSGTEFTNELAKDTVGSTTYTFTGKYNYGRFTNSPTDAEKLRHEETLVHKVFDIAANTTKLTVAKGHQLTAAQAKDAVMKAQGSEDLPTGTTYEWVENPDTSTPGVRTYKVKVTLPPSQTGSDQPTATQKQPSKTIDVTVNVKPTAPTVTPATNGDVTVTPANETNVTKLEVTYTPADTNRLEDNGNVAKTTHTPTKIAASKGANNKWTITEGDKVGVTINGDTGAITLKDHIVKDGTSVSSTDSAQDVSSDSN